MSKNMVKWSHIIDYLRVPCPLCDHANVILEYAVPFEDHFLGYEGEPLFRCPRCEVYMGFEECERFRREAAE